MMFISPQENFGLTDSMGRQKNTIRSTELDPKLKMILADAAV